MWRGIYALQWVWSVVNVLGSVRVKSIKSLAPQGINARWGDIMLTNDSKVIVPSRREIFHRLCGCVALGATFLSHATYAAEGKKTKLSAQEALTLLKDGNKRFLSEQSTTAPLNQRRRLEIARAQTPFAVLVSCADSRVPPELLFGRGLGELFIVRNAGNTVDTVALGSIEYAVAELGVPLIVVMGHERCGAVVAAVDVVENHATFPGSIGQMVEPIIPAVLRAQAKLGTAHANDRTLLLDAAIRENVMRVVNRLRSSEAILTQPLGEKRLDIVGARYDLDDGRVTFFDGQGNVV
jgi:carbonic anhydrase